MFSYAMLSYERNTMTIRRFSRQTLHAKRCHDDGRCAAEFHCKISHYREAADTAFRRLQCKRAIYAMKRASMPAKAIR